MPGVAKNIIIGLSAILILSGCSIISYSYNRADWFLSKEAQKYLNLNKTQQIHFRGALDKAHLIHRQRELPHYVAFLKYTAYTVADGINAQKVERIIAHLQVLFKRLLKLLIDVVAPTLIALEPAQLDYLESALQKHNKKQTKNLFHGKPEKLEQRRIERLTKLYKFWFSYLTPPQKNLLEKAAKSLPDIEVHASKYNRIKQQQLLSLLRQQPTSDDIREFLHAWWVNGEGKNKEHQQFEHSCREILITLSVQLLKTHDQYQQRHLQKKLKYFAKELEKITPNESRVHIAAYYQALM